MSNQSSYGRTPSVEEFTGWYNVETARQDGVPVLCSAEQVPKFSHAEFVKVYRHAEKWFSQLVARPLGGDYDPFAEPPFFVRSDADDRTLDVDVDFDLLTVPILQRIQQQFVGRYPLWRVILIAEDPSLSVVIYPDVMRFGNCPIGVDAERALAELVIHNRTLRTVRERPKREFLAQLCQLLPNAIQAIGDQPFLLAGVLDNHEGDNESLTVCLLVRGNNEDAYRVEAIGDPDLISTAGAFGLDSGGRILGEVEIPKAADYCLSLWLVPSDYYDGSLKIVDQEGVRQLSYRLKARDIIRRRPLDRC